MDEHEHHFNREEIDTQTERSSRQLAGEEHRLIQGIYTLSQNYARKKERSFERIWSRLEQGQRSSSELFSYSQDASESKALSLKGKGIPPNDSSWETETSTLRVNGAMQPGKRSHRSFKRLFGTGITAAAVLALVLSWALVSLGIHTRPQASSTAATVKQQTSTTTQMSSPYPLFKRLAFRDSLTTEAGWQSYGDCEFSSTGLRARVELAEHEANCLRKSGTFGEMAYQVTVTLTWGNCGGLLFRYVDADNYGIVYFCDNGYNLAYVVANKGWALFPKDRLDPVIHQGLNQPNVVAVTIRADEVNIYINGHMVTSVHQAVFTGPLSHGRVGLAALDFDNPTSVTFTNAMVWTA